MTDFIEKITRGQKSALLLMMDSVVIVIAFYAAFALRLGTVLPFDQIGQSWVMLPMLVACGIVYAIILGLPKIKLHAFEIQASQAIGLCAGLLALSAMSLSYIFGYFAPRSVPIIFGALFFIGSISIRMLALFVVIKMQTIGNPRIPVAIYGAGSAGIQLVSALRASSEVKPVAMVDDNLTLQNLIISGLSVHAPSRLPELVRAKKIERILIAMPSIARARQREILAELDHLDCDVQVLPSYVEMIEGNSILDSLRPVSPEELLGREKLDLVVPHVAEAYQGKSILVSGAGGSIGSELCRQLLNFSPSRIVLLEQSEFALYSIERDLVPLAANSGVEIVPVLGSVCNVDTVARVIAAQGIDVVLHAAAYKHVPLVECNELAGLSNNVLGTQVLAQAAANAGVERFVLISTDKAVRPTNVMGASKRLAELVLQDIDARHDKTIFSMVRFGNVLGSSGSVIPLFQEQIAKGGPVTLTHDEVTRFFMAISEAARLVLIACSMATGGDVFLLDMGKSVKIRDLAERMIELSGLSVVTVDNPNGDIEIVTTGLRPGEKLYEELLVGGDTLATPHPKILRAKENSLSSIDMAHVISVLGKAVEDNDVIEARALLARWVEGYHLVSAG